jgi:hypothetical protein
MHFSRFLARADFSHLYNVQPRSRNPTSLLYNSQWCSFTTLEEIGSKADHPPQSTAEAKNEWCYTSTTCLHCIHTDFTAHHMPSLYAHRLYCTPHAFIVYTQTLLHTTCLHCIHRDFSSYKLVSLLLFVILSFMPYFPKCFIPFYLHLCFWCLHVSGILWRFQALCYIN